MEPGDTDVTRALVTVLFLCTASAVGVSTAAAQTPLTLEEAMKRAQGETVDARALAATIAEAEARMQGAQSGLWPRVDLTETLQRGNNPVYAFSSLLSQRRFTAANFALPSLNHPDPVTNTRTAIGIDQPIFDAGLTTLGMKAKPQELEVMVEYLARHFPADEIPPLNVNKARAIDFESRLSLPRSQAALLIEYRTKHGPFKNVDELKKVPGVDAGKIEAKKDQLIFLLTP